MEAFMRMYLISDNVDTYTGMKLSGVNGVVVHTKHELKDVLDTVLSDKTIGIILITEKLSSEFPEIINNIKLNKRIPLIVEIPDRHGTGRKPDFITAYVNEAIGLKL
jgi:V/A-type H+-transporting ATPase subunit F